MNRHFHGLEILLFRRQVAPCQRPIHLTRPQLFDGVWKSVRGSEVTFHGGKATPNQPNPFLPFPSLPSNFGPVPSVLRFIAGDVFGQTVEWKVRCGECEVMKKRLLWVITRMILQTLNGMISNRSRPVEFCPRLDRREFLVIEIVDFWIKESALVAEIIGAIKTVFEWHSIHMPLAGMIGPVPERP